MEELLHLQVGQMNKGPKVQSHRVRNIMNHIIVMSLTRCHGPLQRVLSFNELKNV